MRRRNHWLNNTLEAVLWVATVVWLYAMATRSR